MGYGRAGWYSYDALDMRGRSSEAIVPEWQSIEVGAFMPASAGGGFEIAQVEPEHALVLYLDNEIVDRQARSAHETTAQVHGTERMPAGLAASTAILRTQPQRFRVTWAFVLEPIDGERTRLVERVRVEFPEMESWSRFSVPLVGFGVFVMTQRQMLGIKSRAERLVHPKVTQALDDTIVPAGPSELLPV
jgi:hypothetical protein